MSDEQAWDQGWAAFRVSLLTALMTLWLGALQQFLDAKRSLAELGEDAT